MPNPPTYADAIAEVKEWIAYEIESYSHLLENSNDRVTRVFFCGRLDELHAIDAACDALLALNRREEEK